MVQLPAPSYTNKCIYKGWNKEYIVAVIRLIRHAPVCCLACQLKESEYRTDLSGSTNDYFAQQLKLRDFYEPPNFTTYPSQFCGSAGMLRSLYARVCNLSDQHTDWNNSGMLSIRRQFLYYIGNRRCAGRSRHNLYDGRYR